MVFSRTYLITFFLVLIPNYAASITFGFTNIVPQSQNIGDIIVRGEGAYISGNGIQLTPDDINGDWRQRAGRATYIRPLHLWSNTSGKLASFSTNFTFVIDSNGNYSYGDGLTFFLAENNSVITPGGAMGLPIKPGTIDATNRFVAVKFDTYGSDAWDPKLSPNNADIGNYVGISISSLNSVRFQSWMANVPDAAVCQAWVAYDAVSKILSVSFNGFPTNTVIRQEGLSYTVDLKTVLPERVIFGFSAATGSMFQRNTVISWTFDSSEIDKNNDENGKKNKVGLIVGLAVGIPFLLVLAVVLWIRKKKRKEDGQDTGFDVEMNSEFEMGTGPKRFFYHELARSTSNFAENQKLGEGGFGGVYKGLLKNSSTYVAVKRVSKSSRQGIKEYASEVRIISRLRHRNLVQLTGWCHEKGELLLVYEYMENGSLDSHLFKAKTLLTWGTRYKIAHGLASALLYLHGEWDQCVLHRDIKSSNVMLDSNFNAKLGDFGLAKLVDHEKGSHTTLLAGTLGYMAPECVVTGKATKESDVYSFGVVVLEITCGRKAIEYDAQENQIRLIEWVWEVYGTKTLLEAVDGRLRLDFEEEEIKRLMMVGLWCVHPDPELRPTMRQVIQVLNSEASVPTLPLKMPVASYLTPALDEVSSTIALSNHMPLSTTSSYLSGR